MFLMLTSGKTLDQDIGFFSRILGQSDGERMAMPMSPPKQLIR
jgi:hypothetical protein